MRRPSRSTTEYETNSPEDLASAAEDRREPRHQSSLTCIAQDAARSGIVDPPPRGSRDQVPGEEVLRVGDPDVALLESEYSGEEIPGGSMSAPDQNNVDDVGRAYGMTDADSGALVSVEDLQTRRDQHRWELDPRSKDVEG